DGGGGLASGAPADGAAPAGVGADPVAHAIGVAVDDGDLIDGHVELIATHLRERRLVTLTVRRRSGVHEQGSRRLDPHRRALPRTNTGLLDVAGEADAEAAPGLAGLGLPYTEIG